MRIRLYGRLGDAIGRETEVNAPRGSTVADVRRLLGSAHPVAADALDRSRALVASIAVRDDHRLADSDELEFLPPVSGG